MSDSGTQALLDSAFLARLERLALHARKTHLGSAKGERRSKRKGISAEFADYRDYVQGDDLRHVDWNLYGRLDSLHLKLFQEQEDLAVYILIDGSRSMGFGSPPKFDFARQLAAALGYIGLTSYDRVSVEAFSGEAYHRLAPMRGKAQAAKMFAFLENLTASGTIHLEKACREHALRNRIKGVTILISDFLDEAGYEEPLRRLQASGSEIHVVQTLAPEELDPHLSGDLRLIDSETQAFTEISVSRELLRQYARNRDEYLEKLRKFVTGRGMYYVLAPSNTPVETVTLDLLRRSGLVR